MLNETFTDIEKAEIRQHGYIDPVFFMRFMFKDKFSKPMPWFHRGMLALAVRKTDFLLTYGELDKIFKHFVWKQDPDDENSPEHPLFIPIYEGDEIIRIDLVASKHISEMVPRSFSKTTLMGFGVVLWKILYQEASFILYVSEAGVHAETQLRNVRMELETNARVHSIFGDIVPERAATEKWTDKFIQTTTGICATARGRGGQVRGLNVGGKRPDLVIVDDVEDLESVSTDEQRTKVKTWFFNDLLPVLPKMGIEAERASFIVLGTLLHSEALLKVIERNPKFTSITLDAIDRDGDPLWNDNMTLKDLEAEKYSYAVAGDIAGFYREYRCQLRNDETAKFKKDNIVIKLPSAEVVATAIALDPAISEKKTADYASIAVVSMLANGKINVREAWGEKGVSPRDLIDKYFELEALYDCNLRGVEANAYQASLIHLMKEEMYRPQLNALARRHFEIIAITHSTKKTTRVEGVLQPRYANKYIEHSRHFALLETQLLDWPSGKKDLPDVVAMAVTLLDPYAAQAADPEQDIGEDEYESLDELFEGRWETHECSYDSLAING